VLVFGRNVAFEYLSENKKVINAFIQDTFNDKELLDLLSKRQVKVKRLSKIDLNKKVSGVHQGIILEVPDYKYASLDDLLVVDEPLIVILDHIEDPHNFGAIIRTCEATGVDGIIIPDDRCCDVNGTVVKTSVGTTEKVKIARVKNLANTIDRLKDKGFWIFGTDMDGEDFRKLDYKGKTAIICGNEGSGMSRLVHDKCDFIASIPMQGTVNSLNASVATAIVIFEATRIRGL
jgi:23S rRNA (guanosine2251-2'-O)-methyltransferase